MQHKLLCLVFVVALLAFQVEAAHDNEINEADLGADEEEHEHGFIKPDEEDHERGFINRDEYNPEEGGFNPPKGPQGDEYNSEEEGFNPPGRPLGSHHEESNYHPNEPPIDTNRGLDFEPMKPDVVKQRGLKCVPGRTVVHMGLQSQQAIHNPDEDDDDYRRTHMNWQEDKSKEECKICTCSLEGKDEYCSGRPARNLNECLVLARLTEEQNSNMPFGHERELSNRVLRRFSDLLWHNDEIPYESKAKCQRGFSYYSNSINANDTDIDVPEDVNSLLDYPNLDVCSYCICSTSGRLVNCLPRDPWFCEHYRTVRQKGAMRESYAKLFQQDRPSYFRSLSYRLRRTMNWGLIDMIDIAQKKLKRPACIPYVSEYTDCSEYTTCRGCNQCRCNADGQWVCYKKKNTCADDDYVDVYEDGTDDNMVGNMMQEMAQKERNERSKKRPTHLAPMPEKRQRPTESPVLDFAPEDAMMELHKIMREKRSTNGVNGTDIPIQFHHTIDELNEDTLKNSNISGTLGVRKIEPIIKSSRRAGVFVNSTSDPLHIEYNQPTIYNNHITDNKIETSHNPEQFEALANEKLHDIINYTQNAKDKVISKLVVNELKRGSETIGDPNAPVASNITFTPEKDTLTAMAHIAGNLLNKLWSLVRDEGSDSIETDNMKNQKIADLLDLFKEPLTYRQERFLKEALEHLSDAVNKNKNDKHFTLCDTVEKLTKNIAGSDEIREVKKKPSNRLKEPGADKLIEILGLIKKYETVQENIYDIKRLKDTLVRNRPELRENRNDTSSLNLFGNILEKITNLLLPNSKKMKNRIRSQNMFRNTHNLGDDVRKVFNINLDGMKLTAADKLILDYINRLQLNPCPLSNQQEDKSMRYKQSDILLNLSEFFKIKSYSDLMKIKEPKTSIPTTVKYHESRRAPDSTDTEQNNPPSVNDKQHSSDNTDVVVPRGNSENTDIEQNNTPSVNDKLKLHLKAIVNDLIELQHEKGKDVKSGDINIVDALPCIFKILNQEKEKDQLKEANFYTQSAILNKIKNVLEAAKKDIKETPQSRRSMNTGPRPKSAVVWERLVKNLDQNPKPTRRFFKVDKPHSYKLVKKMIAYIESNISNTYKIVALNKEVPAADKLVFLKTLLNDVYNYANVLGKLLVLNREKKLPEKDLDDLVEFVDTATADLGLDTKVMKDFDKPKPKRVNGFINNGQALKTNTPQISGINGKAKVTTGEAIDQLIQLRTTAYLKKKESEGVTEDIGYDLAQKIMSNLDRGNDELARELFKLLHKMTLRENSTPATMPISRSSKMKNNQWMSEDMLLKTLESAWAQTVKE